MPPYQYSGPVDCATDFDVTPLRGKMAIITGGANGLGEGYVRALVSAGVHVCIGDLDVAGGEKLANELANVYFVRCNTTKWDDQILLFKEAARRSPTGSIHYVVANAGTIKDDQVFSVSESDEPEKPDLSVIDINLHGSLYTTKLATHYFVKQNGTSANPNQVDTCLILIGSGAAFLDCLRIPQYCATKWAARGIMHALRRTAYHYGSRVNVISPWYVKTKILSEETFREVTDAGVVMATTEEAGECLLRILSDTSINGHSFFISGRKWAPRGYLDLDIDDYRNDQVMESIQYDQMVTAPAEKGLFM